MSPATPAPEPGRRRDWRHFFVQEWGLLLLAGVLTWIIWSNVREEVVQPRVIRGVGVHIVVDDQLARSVGAVVTHSGVFDLTVNCSVPEKERIVRQLEENGRKLDLVVFGQALAGGRGFDPDITRWSYPFDEDRLEPAMSPQPGGRVFPIRERDVPVRRPTESPSTAAALATRGLALEVKLNKSHVSLVLPEDSPVTELVPDPIDISRLLGGDSVPIGEQIVETLTFRRWQQEAKDDWRAAWRKTLAIEPITAILSLHEIGEMSIQNQLFVLIDARYEWEFDRVVKGVSPSGEYLFKGTLKGRLDVLKELKADADARGGNWYWGIRITNPDKLPPQPENGEEQAPERVSAEIGFYVSKQFKDRGIVFEPTVEQETIDLQVRWRPGAK